MNSSLGEDLNSQKDDFLEELRRLDRSPATLRSYELGLGHFEKWLGADGTEVDEVSRQSISDYIAYFRESRKEGAVTVDPGKAATVNAKTGKPGPSTHRKPRTVNHRLSVLSSFFHFLIERASEDPSNAWHGRSNPVPQQRTDANRRVTAGGRDLPYRGARGAFRMRVGEQVPKGVRPEVAEELIQAASSVRDKAILALLLGSGQRIGDWIAPDRRHGVLGMRLTDVSSQDGLVSVALKGSRAEHRVPTSDDFWPLLRRYLREERPTDIATPALWVGFRRGAGKPLTYEAFARALRTLGEQLDANVNAHMFRHTLAQLLVDNSGLAVAQKMLGHSQITTTTIYARATDAQLIEAVQNVHRRKSPADEAAPFERFAFPYDAETISELDDLIGTPRNEYPDA